MTLNEIANRLNVPKPRVEGVIEHLLTDSRSLTYPQTTLFFALRTDGGDGHRFIRGLYDRGVRNFVVQSCPQGMDDANFFVVDDSLEALRCVAMPGDTFHGEIVAIVGSRGKTIVKEWIFQLLEPFKEIVRSPRSYNSQIGVPLSLWEIKESTQLAIIEAGVSRTGEMERLASIVKPRKVVFTNILGDHDEGFADRREKAAEKVRIATSGSTETVIYNADDPLLAEAIGAISPTIKRLTWSRKDANADILVSNTDIRDDRAIVTYRYKGEEATVNVPYAEPWDIDNGMAALLFMLSEGYTTDEAAVRFRALHPVRTHLNVSEGINDCTVIYDSYTSDFSTLSPALDFMRRRGVEGKPMTLILSDLQHESSMHGADACREVARLVDTFGISRFIGVGPMLKAHKDEFPQGSLFFDSSTELMETLSTSDFSNETILLKGAPSFGFDRILERLEARKHETVLQVNLDAIVDNYNYFRSLLPKGTGLIAMVKASGYGAGSYEIAKTMQDHGAAYLAVAVLDEGIDLRNRGITMPIMVMNPKVLNYKSMFAYRLEPEIYSMEMLRDVVREAEKNGVERYPVHIKLDTGMHRMGFIEEELPEVMDILEGQEFVKARSVFSHLATADCPDMDDYTMLQLERFRKYTDYMTGRSSTPMLRHVLNSAGILRFPEHHYDMARLGIGLYGVNTLPPEMEKPLATVSALRTMIIAIREWEAGESIGYGRRGMLTRRSRIATIPIGYADGMNRHFGRGNVSVKVNGKWAPTIGNICMDACMIDVTDIDCQTGDEVEIFGPEAPIGRLADVLDTIPYEVLTSVSPRVKRVYYRE